jgi:pyruvate carboxylase
MGQDWVLREMRIEGLKTNLPRLLEVLADERFRSGDYDTGLLGK